MSFIKYPANINVDNDISIIDPEMEKKPKLKIASEILEDSAFSHIPIIFTIIIETLNLIYLGHSSNSNVFNTFGFLICYLYLFGTLYCVGIIKSMNIYQDRYHFYLNYLNFKLIILLLVIFIISPFSFAFYILTSTIFINEELFLWECYTGFVIYSPVIFYLFFLFLLNLTFLQKNGKRSSVLLYCFIFVVIYCVLLYMMLFILKQQIEGIAMSLIITSCICYLISNFTCSDEQSNYKYNKKLKNYNFIPNISLSEIINDDNLKYNISYCLFHGIATFLDELPVYLNLFFSFFLQPNAFTTNIIYTNIFSLLQSFSMGLTSTLKNYIQYSSIGNKHSHQAKIKYVKIFTFVVVCLAIAIAVLLVFLGGNLQNVYLKGRNNEIYMFIQNTYLLFACVVMSYYVSKEFEGYVRGINIKVHLKCYKVILMLVFVPVGLALCFVLDYGIKGIWIGMFMYIIVFMIPNAINVYRHYDLFFQR